METISLCNLNLGLARILLLIAQYLLCWAFTLLPIWKNLKSLEILIDHALMSGLSYARYEWLRGMHDLMGGMIPMTMHGIIQDNFGAGGLIWWPFVLLFSLLLVPSFFWQSDDVIARANRSPKPFYLHLFRSQSGVTGFLCVCTGRINSVWYISTTCELGCNQSGVCSFRFQFPSIVKWLKKAV